MSIAVEIVVEDAAWDDALPDLAPIAEEAARMAADAAGLAAGAYEVVLLACDDARISALNAAFRGKDAPTNVLSFPYEAPDGAADLRDPAAPRPLGDVALALQTVQREADAAAIPLQNHVTHLILHGCLHLLGFDHVDPEEAERMEDIERRALAAKGIPDPYLEHGAGRAHTHD